MADQPSFLKRIVAPIALAGLFFVLGIAATLLSQKQQPSPASKLSPLIASNSVSTNVSVTPPKPWGIVEYKKIPLEESDEIFLDHAERLRKPKWFFENYSPKQLADLIGSLELTPAEKKELLDTNHWEILANGCSISPSENLILELSREPREKIYDVLGRCNGNYNQNYPFRFPPGTFDERFAASGLAPEKINFIRGLCYQNAGLLSFCDFEPVQQRFTTNEFQMLVNSLYSIPAVWMKLRVRPDSDIPALLSYWAKSEHAKQRLKPLLESLSKIRGGTTMNISYFMPAFARLRLYTFPDPTLDPIVAKEDCFYTALNFFNEQPEARFLDPKNNKRVLQTEYALVSGQPTFGDLVTLINSRGDAVHIAVYIADDTVFTKNGANYLQPWVLMKIPDMLAYFPSAEPLRIVAFRRKNFSETPALGASH